MRVEPYGEKGDVHKGSPTKTRLLARATMSRVFSETLTLNHAANRSITQYRRRNTFRLRVVHTITLCVDVLPSGYSELFDDIRQNRRKTPRELVAYDVRMERVVMDVLSERVLRLYELWKHQYSEQRMLGPSRPMRTCPSPSTLLNSSSGRFLTSSTSFGPLAMTSQRSSIATLNVAPWY